MQKYLYKDKKIVIKIDSYKDSYINTLKFQTLYI